MLSDKVLQVLIPNTKFAPTEIHSCRRVWSYILKIFGKTEESIISSRTLRIFARVGNSFTGQKSGCLKFDQQILLFWSAKLFFWSAICLFFWSAKLFFWSARLLNWAANFIGIISKIYWNNQQNLLEWAAKFSIK